MDQETNVIEKEMEQTRASLTEKIETLENQVVNTLENATEAVSETVNTVTEKVQETVETVKDSVADTVESVTESVKETFNLRSQVERHPWAMLGGSVAAGFVVGRLLVKDKLDPKLFAQAASAGTDASVRYEPRATPPDWKPAAEPRGPGWFDELKDAMGGQVKDQLKQVRTMAVGAATGLLWQLVMQSVPKNIAPHLANVMHDLTGNKASQFTPRSGGT